MKFVIEVVERVPKQLDTGVVYYSEEFELAALLCACGCGHRTTLLVPDSHQLASKGGFATVRPSIGAFDSPCRSHYIITDGEVHWLPAFSGHQIQTLMQRQIARHVAADPRRRSWRDPFANGWRRIVSAAKRLFEKLP